MNLLVRLGAACALIAVGSVMSTKAVGKVKKDYQITAEVEPFFDACRSAMRRHSVEYNMGASNNKGCACLAKKAMAEYEGQDVTIVKKYVDSLMAMGGEDADDMAVQLEAIMAIDAVNDEYGVSEVKSMNMLENLNGFVEQCGDRKYHTTENVASLAAMTPKSNASLVNIQKTGNPQPQAKTQPEAPKLRGLSDG